MFIGELKKLKKDPKRKVCKNCNELNHGVNSVSCIVNIKRKENLKNKIIEYISDKEHIDDNHFNYMSEKFNITVNLCKTLYSEIPVEDIINRNIDVDKLIEEEFNKYIPCVECSRVISSPRIWKNNNLCDICWSTHENERDILWSKINKIKPMICNICGHKKNNVSDRFHYDHINMFDKNNSICLMVNIGDNIEIIEKEIDKCQILCFSCHNIVTSIENKYGFTRIKQMITRNINNNNISDDELNNKINKYSKLYNIKMENIYNKLRDKLRDKL